MAAPTLDLAPVRTAIKNKIAGVANMGVVQDYERYTKEASKLLTLYQSAAQGGNRIYGWFVSRRATRELYQDIGRWIALVDWSLTAYMGLDDGDATEKLFDVQIELVRDAFRDDDSLGGIVANGVSLIVDSGGGTPTRGVQVIDVDKVLFANVLCHRARCSLTTVIYF